MQKSCTSCGQTFEISKEDLAFLETISPTFSGKKYAIPPPTLCPQCRLQRRLLFRNERHLYHRKSDLTGKQIVSMYAPDKSYKVYDQDEWWGDKWDGLDYGRDFDFNRTFTEQFAELCAAVPHNSLFTTNVQNSYFTNHTLNCKNCYLLFGGGNNEDCLFGRFIVNSADVLEGLSLYSCERCYEGIASEKCYGCLFFSNCRNCTDCLMVEDCQSCRNCTLCFGLTNAEYCFLNERVGKEEYEKRMRELGELTPAKIALMKQKLAELKMKLPHRASHIHGSEDCTGDMIFGSKDCHYCFDITDCEDCTYTSYTPKGKSSIDCTYTAPDGVEWCYDVCSTVGAHMCMATFLCWYGDNMYYSRECSACSNIFGCCGLKKKSYCIFNKQYAKEEYEMLVPKIIEHMSKSDEWGEHLSPTLSLMGYNESVADELFPMTKEETERRGWHWYDEANKTDKYLGPKTEAPEVISKTDGSICDKILICEATKRPYKVIPQELAFYRKLGIPIPRKCPDARHRERINQRNPRQLWLRKCDNCSKQIETSYAPERAEKVFCEECYLKTVY